MAQSVSIQQESNQAMMVQRENNNALSIDQFLNPGGIDFAQSNLDLQIKRDGAGVLLPISQQSLENIRIEGLVPVILSIEPLGKILLISTSKL